MEYRGALVAEVARLSDTEKRWIDGAASMDGMAWLRSPRKRMTSRHYINVSEKGSIVDRCHALKSCWGLALMRGLTRSIV